MRPLAAQPRQIPATMPALPHQYSAGSRRLPSSGFDDLRPDHDGGDLWLDCGKFARTVRDRCGMTGCAFDSDGRISPKSSEIVWVLDAMSLGRFTRLARSLTELFPERHLYVRSGGEMKGYVLTTQKQMAIAGVVAVCALWMGVSTAATLVALFTQSKGEAGRGQDPGQVRALDRRPRCAAEQRRRPDQRHRRLVRGHGQHRREAQRCARHAADRFEGRAGRGPGAAAGDRQARLAQRHPDPADADRAGGPGPADRRGRDIRQEPRRPAAPGVPTGRARPGRLRRPERGARRTADRRQGPARPRRRPGRGRGLRRPYPARRRGPLGHAGAQPGRARHPPGAAHRGHPRDQRLWRARRSLHRPARLSSGPGFRRRLHDPDRRHGARRGVLHRPAQRLRQHHRDRSWPRIQDPLRAPGRDIGRGRPARRRGPEDRRHGFDRPFDRHPPALRGLGERPGSKSPPLCEGR